MPIKVKIEENEKTLKLMKQLGSSNKSEAQAAHEALARWIGPVLHEVINAAPTLSNYFTPFRFGVDDNPSIPLDLYRDVTDVDYISVWSQSMAGGMPYNQPTPVAQELKFQTYPLTSAVAFQKRWAQRSRLDVLAKTMARLAQETMLKQEVNSSQLILRALANAKTTIKDSTEVYHVIRSNTAGRFLLADLNKLFTLQKRIRSAWNKGTPSRTQSRGLTDLLISPEIAEEIRGMAYNPVNTKAGVVTGGAGVTSVTLTDSQREAIYNSAGLPEFYGVSLMELNELGLGYTYNNVFDIYAGSNGYVNHGENFDSTSTTAFDGNTEELLIGLDLTDDSSLVRGIVTDGETGADFTVLPDDQFATRSQMIGFYGQLEEGRMILDEEALCGLII